jgi:TIR domain
MSKPVIFISHISEEADLAAHLKAALSRDFLSIPDVFVSSDTQSIGAGSNWLSSIEDALRDARVLLILCSAASIRRPWIHFEAGAAWMRQIPIIPVCHSAFHPPELPMPLSVLQAVQANQLQGLKRIYSRVAEHLQCAVPAGSLDELRGAILAFEQQYVPAPEPADNPQTRHAAAWRRMKEALSDTSHKWRTLDRLLILGGVSEDEALEILGQQRSVVFGKGKKTKKRLVRLATNDA